ncbi:MAG: TIGR03936 family radical SAM-associated protein [Lachnospiraceae bacterium]|nr:TIGR03936 family radical SAM-associated protein [Lachnospiraceae bacterium]
MKIRIKFSKNDSVKFLGHLDIMRFFQRAFVRAGVKMLYSEGFNPHQKMSFAQPLGVGITSTGEYLDADVVDGQDLTVIKENLDKACQGGFDILSVKELPQGVPNAMSAVKYASYSAVFNENMLPDINGFMAQESIFTNKRTKSGIKEIDIKPLIYKCELNGNTLHFIVSAGSENNIKPDLLLENLMSFSGLQYSRDMVKITRRDLLGDNFIPLSDL